MVERDQRGRRREGGEPVRQECEGDPERAHLEAPRREDREALEFGVAVFREDRGDQIDGDQVTATFELGQRPGHHCDAPGAVAYAVFQVLDGKIVLWNQIEGPAATPDGGQQA